MNTPHDPFESGLRQRLQSTPIDLPDAAGPHAAANRAAQRSRRRRGAMASVAAIAVLGGMAPLVLGGDDDGSVDTQVAAPIDADGVEFAWETHDGGLAQMTRYTSDADGFYALSTAPGATYDEFPSGEAPKAIYRLVDGSWVPTDLGDDDPRIASLTTRNGTLYALSTSPDTGAPIGSVSTDGGATWTDSPLGNVQPPSDSVDWGMTALLDVASTADVTLALVSHRFLLPDDLFPEIDDSGPDYYHQIEETADGIDIVKVTYRQADTDESGAPSTSVLPDGLTEAEIDRELDAGASGQTSDHVEKSEVVRTVSWADLGVDGPVETTTTVYRVDGNEWTPVAEETGSRGATMSLSATDDAILWETATTDGPRARYTVDGATWQDVATPEGTPGSTVLAPNGDLIFQSLSADGVSEFSVSRDLGATWSPIDLRSLVPGMDDDDEFFAIASSGPLGVGILFVEVQYVDEGESPDVSSPTMLFSTDLTSWSVTDLSDVAPTDRQSILSLDVGTDRIVVQAAGVHDATSDVRPHSTLVATPVR